MKLLTKRLRADAGFTLVELMVVVAIIGLLSAVAIPNFKKYQAKAKTSEAKLQLASLYSAQTSFFSDYDYYATCLNLMGFDPSGEAATRYYAVGFGASVTATVATAAVSAGAISFCGTANTSITAGVSASSSLGHFSYGAGKGVSGLASGLTSIPATYTVGANGDLFTAGANGAIVAGYTVATNASEWSMTEAKVIRQIRVGY